MKTVEDSLASGFEKIKKIDVLDSALADCESRATIVTADKTKCRPKLWYITGMAAALVVVCAAFTVGNLLGCQSEYQDGGQ